MSTRARRKLIQWLVVVALFVVAILPIIPPVETGAGEATAFSTGSALNHVEAIARQPHPIGSEENARVRQYLGDELDELGLAAETQTIEVMDYFGTPGNTVPVVNVMARIAGSYSTGALALVAHYDTVPSTPGANDDSGAVATLLEIG
ncbi:MAG: M28 family peptidase, partial [Acidimicrobiia bacterium]|nr:M28 family peptidase [Acidimicrobiia bacterium]